MTVPVGVPVDTGRMPVPSGSTAGFDLAGSHIVWWESHSNAPDRIRLLSFPGMGVVDPCQPLGDLFAGGVLSATTDVTGDAILVQPTERGEDTPVPVLLRRQASLWSAVVQQRRFSHPPSVTAIGPSGFLLVGTECGHPIDASSGIYRMDETGMHEVGRLRPAEQLVGPRPLIHGGPAHVIARTRTGGGPEMVHMWRITDDGVERVWAQPLPTAVPVAEVAGAVMALARPGKESAEMLKLDPATGRWEAVASLPHALDIAAAGDRILMVGGQRGLRLAFLDAGGNSRHLHDLPSDARVVRMASHVANDNVVLLTRNSTWQRQIHCLSTTAGHTATLLHEPEFDAPAGPCDPRVVIVTSRMTVVSADVNTLHRAVLPALTAGGAKIATVDRHRRSEPLDADLYTRFIDDQPSGRRYILEGHSVDAVPAFLAACARPDSVAALILRFPVLDLAALTDQPGGWRWRDTLDDIDAGWRTRLEPMRVLEHAQQLPPVLIVTGANDMRATRDAEPFFARYRCRSRAPDDCRLIQYDCGHDRHVDPGPARQQVKDIFEFITASRDDRGARSG